MIKKISLALLGSLMFASSALASTGLTVTALCSDTPDTVLNYQIDNSTGTPQDIQWRRNDQDTGTTTVATTTPFLFSTGASTTTPNQVRVIWSGGTIVTPASTSTCPVVVATSTPSTGHSYSSSSGGRRHSYADMVKMGLFPAKQPTLEDLKAQLAYLLQQLALLIK